MTELLTVERVQRYGAHGPVGAINMVVVIESLRPGDWKTGRALRDDLEKVALPYGNNLPIHYKTARSADELEFLLKELYGYISLCGRAPMLHIECHGNADGIQLADGSVMRWNRLKPLLVDINRASRINVFLVMACCYGGYFAAECRYSETVPFAWILGPGKEIEADPLLALNGAFYTELFKSRDVTEALTAGGAARPSGISYFSLSAVGVFRIALTARIKAVESVDLRARTRTIDEPMFDRYRRQFFALEEFAENEGRFAISYREVFTEVATAK